MAKLPSSVNLPSIRDLERGSVDPRDFVMVLVSSLQYWIQRIVARINNELLQNYGTEEVNLYLALLGSNAGLSVNSSTTKIVKVVSLTTSLDIPSIPAQGQAELTVTMTGVVPNKTMVVVNYEGAGPEAGIAIGGAWVPAADTVRVRFVNITTAAVDPAPASYRFTAIVFA